MVILDFCCMFTIMRRGKVVIIIKDISTKTLLGAGR